MEAGANAAELLKQQQRGSLQKLDAEQATRVAEKTAVDDENAKLRVERRNSAKLLSDAEQTRRIAAQKAELGQAEAAEAAERVTNRAAADAAMEEERERRMSLESEAVAVSKLERKNSAGVAVAVTRPPHIPYLHSRRRDPGTARPCAQAMEKERVRRISVDASK